MKSKQFLLVCVLVVLLLLGWIKAMQIQSADDILAEQNMILAEADSLAEKELYIRAIPLYEKALEYDTEQNNAIELTLLDLYKQFGAMNSYETLLIKRIRQNTASEMEYLSLAELYLGSNDLEEGLQILEEGLKMLGETESLRTLYETHRYKYDKYDTHYEKMSRSGNALMPVCNRETGLWGYCNDRGRLQIECVYESVTPFNAAGYAVVKQDGQYKVIVESGYTYGVDELGAQNISGINREYVIAQYEDKYSFYNYDFQNINTSCRYDEIIAGQVGYTAARDNEKWGFISGKGELISEMRFDEVSLSSLGYVFARVKNAAETTVLVASVREGDSWYLVLPDGCRMTEVGFAGLKAPEGDGWIAAADPEGKWGFVDLSGTVQIPFQYEDARSFSENLAAVKKDGEWVYINVYNEVVIEEDFLDAEPFYNGVALVYEDDGISLLHLEYTGNSQ